MTLQLANYFTQHALLSLGEGRSYRFKGSGDDDDDHLQDCVLGLKPSLRSMCVSKTLEEITTFESDTVQHADSHVYLTHTQNQVDRWLSMCV